MAISSRGVTLVCLALGSLLASSVTTSAQETQPARANTNPPRVQTAVPNQKQPAAQAPARNATGPGAAGGAATAPRPTGGAAISGTAQAAPNGAAARQPAPASQAPSSAIRQAQATQPIAGPPGRPQATTGQAPAATNPRPIPQLTPQEQAELDQVLATWEQKSDKVTTLSATFTMWEYDLVFGAPAAAGQPPKEKRVCEGVIHFAAPDRGSYQMTKGGEERWMCDGKAIYEFDHKQKKLKEYRLPKELQGKAITKGPLPFVFGAKADSMKQRYVMRIFTPPDVQGQIWIEAWPRWQQDAANFHHVQVILDAKTMIPAAIRVYDPNPNMYKVYAFDKTKVNGAFDQIKDFFSRPMAPLGWQHVVEEPPAEALPKDPPATPTADARNAAPAARPVATKK